MARKIARELGVDLSQVTGTGPGGRITKEDVEKAAAAPAAPTSAPAPAAPAAAPAGTVPVRGMRKTIAERMHDSLQSMAQLTMDMDVNMDDAIKLRNQLVEEWADEGVKPTYTDLVIRAVARALQKHPLMNASWGDQEITLHGDIHVGILGVNRIRDDIAWEGDKPVKTQVMRLSLTWDHRVLDGGPAALFLGEVKALLEAPYRLLL